MKTTLTPVEARVLGCMVEKETTTPDYYPLTLNALISACNQKSSRDPVMCLDEETVTAALDELRYQKELAWQVTTPGSRTPKYKHDIAKIASLSQLETAVLCVLLLRGAQTPGELRSRTSRFCKFGSLDEVDEVLGSLMDREDGPLVARLSRTPGSREQRYGHLLCGDVEVAETVENATADAMPVATTMPVAEEINERIAALEQAITEVRGIVDDLVNQFSDFKRQFE